MKNNIEKFLQYDGDYASQWLVQAVQFIIMLNDDDELISKIFELSQIEINVTSFKLELENSLREISDIKYEKKRSPDELQDYIGTWVYYSIFWVCDFKKVGNKHDYRKYRMITHTALTFHLHYLKYISTLDENSQIHIKSREYAANTVVRVIEILVKIAQKKSAYLTEKYFPEDVSDIFVNFINIIENDYVEKDCFFIKKNPDGQHEIYIKYYNPYVCVDFQLLPSRNLSRGSSKTSESAKNAPNRPPIAFASGH